ncbi:MAG: DUF4013 domain-containing protein [Chloroflexota bacterium]|jgi:hypothetical protein
MDIAKSFTYVFEDEDWVTKLIVGAVVTFLSFLILPIPLLTGYAVAVVRNVRDGYERPLPAWDDWGKLFMDGLAVMVAQFVYTLPFLLLFCIVSAGMVASIGVAELSEELAVASMFTTFGLLACIFFIWMLALLFISPAIMIQYSRTGQLGSCFRFGEVIAIARRNTGDILLALVAVVIILFVLGAVSSILSMIPCLGAIAAFLLGYVFSPYMTMVTGHLYGQIAAKESGIGPEKWEKGADFT